MSAGVHRGPMRRFDLEYGAGMLAHERLLRCVELYGKRGGPAGRELLA